MRKNFLFIFSLIIGLILLGGLGYILIEKWNFIDAIYMTIITLTTVGYREVHPLSYYGKIFTIIFILFGILVFGIIVTKLMNFFVEAKFGEIFRRKIMKRRIQKLKNHYIVCGLGDIGKTILEEFERSKILALGIDKDKEVVETIKTKFPNFIIIHGDATDDEVLIEAGIKNAKGVLASLASDVENLYLVISARNLNPNVRIIAKATEESSQIKMKKAGADCIISPDIIGGLRMASMAIRPDVVSFLDIITRNIDQSWRIEQVTVPENSSFIGKTLKEVAIPSATGLLVISIKGKDNKFIYNPPANFVLNKGDILLVLGDEERINKLKNYLDKGKIT